jgi:hypothetical protein
MGARGMPEPFNLHVGVKGYPTRCWSMVKLVDCLCLSYKYNEFPYLRTSLAALQMQSSRVI